MDIDKLQETLNQLAASQGEVASGMRDLVKSQKDLLEATQLQAKAAQLQRRATEGASKALENFDDDLEEGARKWLDMTKEQQKDYIQTKKAQQMGKRAFDSLTDGVISASRAMLEGKKGATAFNDALGHLVKAAGLASAALMILGGPIGRLAGVVMGLFTAIGAYAQAAAEMADKLYDGYSGMAKAGGSASDGMRGLFGDAKKLGLSMNELGDFVNVVSANSKDLALFSGTVFNGRKQLADLGGALRNNRYDFLMLGMSMSDVTDGLAGFMRQQRNLTGVNKQTTDQLAEGARKYLLEQDALTKLTGQSRKEMEDANERAMQNEQFGAKIRQLEMSGQVEAARQLKQLNKIYALAGPATQEAFQATVTGNLTNQRAQQANIASQGEMMRTTQMVIAGQIDEAEAAQRTMKTMGEFNDRVGTTSAQLGAYDFSLPFYEGERARVAASHDLKAQLEKIKDDQNKTLKGSDGLLAGQASLRDTQISANEAMENLVLRGIGPVQRAMNELANVTLKLANLINRILSLFGMGEKTPDQIAKEQADQARVEYLGKEIETKAKEIDALKSSLDKAKEAGNEAEAKRLEDRVKSAEALKFAMERGKSTAEAGVTGASMFDGFEQRSGGSLDAAGRLIEDFGKGTPTMLHGREGVITEAQLKQFGDMAMKVGMGSVAPTATGTVASSTVTAASGGARKIMASMMTQMDTMLDYQREFGTDTAGAQNNTLDSIRRIENITLQSRLELDKDRLNVDNFVDRRRTLYDSILSNLDHQFQITRATTDAQTPAGGAGGGGAAPAADAVPGAATGGEIKGMPSGGGAAPDIDAKDFVKFTGGTGSKEHFSKLADNVESAFLMMARDYNQLTGGKTLQVNSAFRTPQEQANVDSGTNPKAAPGMSLHNVGRALDIQSAQRNELEQLGLLAKYGFRPLAGDPPHISMREGGIAHGPESGYPAELHGTEAVIPLGDGALTMTVPSVDTLVGVTEDMSSSIQELRNDLRGMITGLQDAMSRTNTADLQGRMVDILTNIERSQAKTADASTRMAQAATN